MHAIFCSTVKSTNSAKAALSSVLLLVLVEFVVVVLVPSVDVLASYNLRVESVMLFVVEFYESVYDVSLVLAVLLSVVVLSEVELSDVKLTEVELLEVALSTLKTSV
jgi:hypothetical protein